jgi:hypothetical protein
MNQRLWFTLVKWLAFRIDKALYRPIRRFSRGDHQQSIGEYERSRLSQHRVQMLSGAETIIATGEGQQIKKRRLCLFNGSI